MLSSIKSWLKRREPFRTISWIRNQMPAPHDLSRFKRCGDNIRISPEASFGHPHRISIGNNVVIHQGAMINGGGGLVIGNNVGISYRTTIWTIDHTYHEGDAIPFDNNALLRPVLIHDNVAIGANVVIMPGVEIGEGAIIGMGAVVTNDVKPLAVMFGNPARPIGFRDEDHYEHCKAARKFYDFGRGARGQGIRIVPRFIQNRPRLYEIVREEVEAGRAILEPAEIEEEGRGEAQRHEAGVGGRG